MAMRADNSVMHQNGIVDSKVWKGTWTFIPKNPASAVGNKAAFKNPDVNICYIIN